jgi:peptidyl-prolyl cis-trans isomerase B (cyclophilin B)
VKTLRVATALAALALTLAGCVAKVSPSEERPSSDFTPSSTSETASDTPSDTASDGASAGATSGDCGFRPDASGEQPAVGLPPDEGPVTATKLTLTTSAGPITIQLAADKAPCTVASQVFLASKGYFNNTVCHRLTASDGLKVLQCGDPQGTGGGGPGYVVPDELPTDLPAGPTLQDGTQTVIYGRGLVAMANAGPDTTGSQFFLVYGDSTLPPNYSVFGTIDQAGLATLDQIAAGGITPGANGPTDGAPVTPVTITAATAA